MNCRLLLRTFLSLAAISLVTSCAEMDTQSTSGTAPTSPPVGYWNGEGVSGSAKIVVSLSEQRAYFYKGNQLVGESTVSTGKPGFSTPPGHYSVVWKHEDHVSTVFGDFVDDAGNVVKSNIDVRKDSRPPGSHYDGARMPYAMFFRGGYAMHQGYVPPYAASHGCIRLPAEMAAVFFNNAPYGTPVIVKQEAVMRTVSVPPLNPPTVAPPPSNFVRSPATSSTYPAPLRSPTPASVVSRGPVPVRYPAPIVSSTPVPSRYSAPVVGRTPLPVRSTLPTPTPFPVRSPASVSARGPASVPLRSPSPAPLRSPAPVINRTSPPLRSPTPAPVRSPSPGPVYSTGPSTVHPTPTPVHSRKRHPVHSRKRVQSPTPSPTPVQ
jgi:hypothetical protein